MNKTAIKNFAIWARRKLISDITYKAGMLGVTENGIAQPLPQSTRDLQFFDIGTKDYTEVSGVAIEQRNALVKVVRAKEQGSDYKTAFCSVVEEVAYTWFNRLIAVRFMEVNDYLPSHLRVLSSENEGKLEPDFVTTPFDTDLEFTSFEQDQVYQLKDENKLDELFRMLFIKQCNKLNEILPGLFEQISDYTELLLNISFTDKDGIVYHLTHDISEDEFNVEKEGQVEIIGWMYQYYNTEPKDEVFALLKKNVKITKERIPAATQLFTPDWIVRYMVENSLGRLWVEGHPDENLKRNWKYYLEEAEQEPEVVAQLKKIREEYAKINPVDIKVIDPCMGSGHILVYAFDVLMQIYTSQGYVERDAAKSILINNLYGIDIDVRAYQLAYFAVMMKARQYNRKIFSDHIMPNLIAIRNPETISKSVLKRLGGLEPVGLRLVEEFEDAEEYGSILQPNVTLDELDRLEKQLEEIDRMADYGNLLVQMESAECCNLLWPLIKQARLLSRKYDVVVTNPPYMALSNACEKVNVYIKYRFPDSKADMFAVFMERCCYMLHDYGYESMVTQQAFLFSPSFTRFRNNFLYDRLMNLIHIGFNSFPELNSKVALGAAFVLREKPIADYETKFLDLNSSYPPSSDKEVAFFAEQKKGYFAKSSMFKHIPNQAITYSFCKEMLAAFSNEKIEKYIVSDGQTKTGDNDKYMRSIWEVNRNHVGKGKRWSLIAKGGDSRKWYGNVLDLIDWSDQARTHYKKDKVARIAPEYIWFRKGICWNHIATSKGFAVRLLEEDTLFETASPAVLIDDDNQLLIIMAFLNTPITRMIMELLNPSVCKNVGDVTGLPIIDMDDDSCRMILELARLNINFAKEDWNSYEISWNFAAHPLVRNLHQSGLSQLPVKIDHVYTSWKEKTEQAYVQQKEAEEKLNRLFINMYGLNSVVPYSISDKEVTVRMADLDRDIRSLISYAVGCMFGRYSLDEEGLVFAGGNWNDSKYHSFIPDTDNCIPITDEEYFSDDIVGRFVEFIRVAYGMDYVEENLDFIAKALGNKGNTSREVIRNYFLNDFYKDHLKAYQKRPIYWLFDSGKQNGFKALVYMHRWNADTVGNLRIEYLHKMQTVYEHEIENCQEMIDHGSGRDVAIATKRKEKLIKQLKECKDYDARVAHIAFSKIDIDLDDGVKANYRKVQTGSDGKFCEILADSKDIMAKEK